MILLLLYCPDFYEPVFTKLLLCNDVSFIICQLHQLSTSGASCHWPIFLICNWMICKWNCDPGNTAWQFSTILSCIDLNDRFAKRQSTGSKLMKWWYARRWRGESYDMTLHRVYWSPLIASCLYQLREFDYREASLSQNKERCRQLSNMMKAYVYK